MRLLFICTHNACRSILGEVITREVAGGRIEVASAGSHPAGRIHPLTLQFLNRQGLPTEDLRSKGFEDLGGFRPDVVITVCDSAAGESCPAWLVEEAVTAHWGLPDPSRQTESPAAIEQDFQDVAEILSARIEALLAQPFEGMEKAELGAFLQSIQKRS
jgi:arsenate reductase